MQIKYEEFIDILNSIIKKYITIKREQESIKKGFKAKYFNGGYNNWSINEIKNEIASFCFDTAIIQYYDRLGKLKGV